MADSGAKSSRSGSIFLPMPEKKQPKIQEAIKPLPVTARMKQNWEDFTDKTGLEGFGYLKDSGNNIEYIMWTIVIVIAVALTIRDIKNSIEDYLEEGTDTEVEVIHNQPIKLNPTICIGLQATRMSDRPIWTNVTNVEDVLSHYADHPNIIDYLSTVTKSFSAPLEDEPGNPLKQFVGLSTQLLFNLVYLENRISPNETDVQADRHFGVLRYNEDVMYVDEGSAASMKAVHDFYDSRNTSFPELMKYIGSILCKSMEVNMGCQNNEETGQFSTSNTSEVCDPERITWLGYEPFNAQGNFLCFNISHPDYFYFKLLEGDDFDNLLNTVMYLDFSGGRSMTRTTMNNLVSGFGQLQTFFLTVLGHYISITTKNKQCSDDVSYLDCRGGCRAKWTMENCGCAPVSWSGLDHITKPDGMPYCSQIFGTDIISWVNTTVPHLSSEKCAEMQLKADPDAECAKACKEVCDEHIFGNQLRELDEGYARDGRANSTTDTGFIIKFDNFVYPEFQEKLSIDFNDLLTNLGGNVGFWIGACIVSCVYLLVWITKLIVSLYFYGQEKKSLRRLKQMEIDSENPALRPTAVLYQLMSFYKSQAATDLLKKMMDQGHLKKKLTGGPPTIVPGRGRLGSRQGSMDIPSSLGGFGGSYDGANLDPLLNTLEALNLRVKRLEKGFFNSEQKDVVGDWARKISSDAGSLVPDPPIPDNDLRNRNRPGSENGSTVKTDENGVHSIYLE